MIVDASIVIDAVVDAGPRGRAARRALAAQPDTEPLIAPGHLAFEVMSGLGAAANRPNHPLQHDDIPSALGDASNFGIRLEATPWIDVARGWELAQGSLRYADAVYVAAAERYDTPLLTSDTRIERSGAKMHCAILTVTP